MKDRVPGSQGEKTPQNSAGGVSCDDELIRVPGSIQPHGFLLAFEEETETITVASENAEAVLHAPLKLLLGAKLETVLDRQILAAVRGVRGTPNAEGLQAYLGAFPLQEDLYSVVTHTVDARRILEFEKLDRLVSAETMNAVITNFVGLLSKSRAMETLYHSIVQQVQDLTGYDRVLLYSFDEHGHGTVLAEENNGTLPSYLGLRFPGTDIPKQARELYVQNTIRIIPNATYLPSPLAGLSGEATQALDLSLSVLRSVSPIHLQYMQNMGTASSMSISIVIDGRLWGLISGHHAKPRSVPYLIRSACDMLSKLVATQIASFHNAARLERRIHFHDIQRELLTEVASAKNYTEALNVHVSGLRRVTDAAGIALKTDDAWTTDGFVPDAVSLDKIALWLEKQPENVYVTNELGKELPWAEEIRSTASGLLAARVPGQNERYLLWFRPEVKQTVEWAGEPKKEETEAQTLTPRHSFASWKETLQGQSEPWTETEQESAQDFLAAIVTVSLRRAEEAAALSEARFMELTQTLPTKIFTVDDGGYLTYTNSRWRDIGLHPSGRWFENGNVAEEDIQRCDEAWERAVREGSEFKEEIRMRSDSKGREELWNFVHIVPFAGSGSAVRAGWVGNCTDLTERREREAAMRMAEKLATTGRMTSVIAHEINNPLESITNLMYLLRAELPEEAHAANEYIAMAESELLRISGITKQTLRWNRDNTSAAEWTTAGALFDDVQRLFAGKIRNRQVKVEVVGGADIPVYGSAGQLRQVIANLLSNAVDAASVGGHAWLSASEKGTSAVLEVKDDGPGISPESMKQLFKPFFSTKGDLGNGLGLYILHEIVERHGGKVEVDSTVGQGATFYVTLPAPLTQKAGK